MAANRKGTVCCNLCRDPSVAMCVACDRYFCWNHFSEHRRTFEKYIDDARNHKQPLFKCLEEFEQVEKELYSDIDNWERREIEDVHSSADEARKAVEDHINHYRSNFEEESSVVAETESVSRDVRSIEIEKLQAAYGRSLKNMRLIPHNGRRPMLDIETTNPAREAISLQESSPMVPRQSGIYGPQTTLGKRLIKQPLKASPVGSYWTIGGSDQCLLVQEYENKQLTLFDRHGIRGISMTWHYDAPIRDIQWNDHLRQFFILLDKKIIVFDPVTKHFQEITQITPYQSNAFRRCACLNDRLFISYWGMESIIELVQISSWSTQQRWLSPVTCHPNEFISCIRINSNEQLALSIQDENNPNDRQFRIELRDITLNILYTLPLHVDSGIFSRMTSLPDGCWAVLNVDANRVLILDEHGKLIDKIDCHYERLHNIALIGESIVVIRDVNKLFFYDVKFREE